MGSLIAALSVAAVSATPIACELFACAAAGGAAACTLPTSTGATMITCAAWSVLPDACGVFCTADCRIDDLPCASDGRAFCNDCLLASALCRDWFRATGPVAGAVCSFDAAPRQPPPSRETTTPSPIDNDDDAVVATVSPSPTSARVGEACASSMVTSDKPCADGLVCVLDDLGFLASDRPDSGTCVAASDAVPIGVCTEELCATVSATEVCDFGGRIATCSAFTRGEDDGSRPGQEGDICCREGNCGINPPPPCGGRLICIPDPISAVVEEMAEETTMPTDPDETDGEEETTEAIPVEETTNEAEMFGESANTTETMGNEAEMVAPQFGTCGYNCRTREVFRPAKADYCCRVKGLGCPPSPLPSPLPLPLGQVPSAAAMVASTPRARGQPTVTVTPTVAAVAATPPAAPTRVAVAADLSAMT
ncbi:hypothetical protein MMPV_007974 [Pyropia vietnamensis]